MEHLFSDGVYWSVPIASFLALLTAGLLYNWLLNQEEGSSEIKKWAHRIQRTADTYLKAEYSTVAKTFVGIFILLMILAYLKLQNAFVPVAFLTGGFFSGLCGYLGMKVATKAGGRTANAAQKSLSAALNVAIKAGAVTGLMVTGFILADIFGWFNFLDSVVYTAANMENGLIFWGLTLVHEGTTVFEKYAEISLTMMTFGIGATIQALYSRVGGGIFTKSADMGSDLWGKSEQGLREDDPRNPGVIADAVGDNAGDQKGMVSDLFESLAGIVLGATVLGAMIPWIIASDLGINPMNLILSPIVLVAIGTLSSIVSIFFIKAKSNANQEELLKSFLRGTGISSIFVVIGATGLYFMNWITLGLLISVCIGAIAGFLIGQLTERSTSTAHGGKAVKNVLTASDYGSSTNTIAAMAEGFKSTFLPSIVLGVAMISSFYFSGGYESILLGLFGISIAAVATLSNLGITLATDVFGPIVDNAGGIVELAGLKKIRKVTDALDSMGNTTAAIGKGFSILSAGLTLLVLIFVTLMELGLSISRLATQNGGTFTQGDYTFYHEIAPDLFDGTYAVEISFNMFNELIQAYGLNIGNPIFIVGAILGAAIIFLFSGNTLESVGKAAQEMMKEIKRQIREIPGLKEGTVDPDYDECVLVANKEAHQGMKFPVVLITGMTTLIGLILGFTGMGGALFGSLIVGYPLALLLNNTGGLLDNSKKAFEEFLDKNHPDLEDDIKSLRKLLIDTAQKFAIKNPEIVEEYENDKEYKKVASDLNALEIIKKKKDALVAGDTVGDPFKDTTGPSINVAMKLMAMTTIIVLPLIIKFNLLSWILSLIY
ncbi:sodium-translocating pyrophosphatase [bacterium]|jgi:K(+)-stimulated pyrophosphate-energized sodium pump|nr:sodium-translocating pyrophosphatase [bacterium]MBT6832253.1 sodium-translocating pyrophosphatase [bacterium]MBT6996190.1 sodium-translocating pyrophosphatase [bacterium]MBT7772437.1 sodium-translocating pyrophosphatase [bacterium]